MILYHITPVKNLNSILEYGLIPNNGFVFLAESREACIQLAPFIAALQVLKRQGTRIKQNMRTLSQFLVCKSIEGCCFAVDMSGLEQRIKSRTNVHVEEYLKGNIVPLTEYMYPYTIPPERIIDYEFFDFEYYELKPPRGVE